MAGLGCSAEGKEEPSFGGLCTLECIHNSSQFFLLQNVVMHIVR